MWGLEEAQITLEGTSYSLGPSLICGLPGGFSVLA